MNTGKKKQSLNSFFSNIWYHYKWHILIGLMLITAMVIATAQCAAASDPDVTVLYIGSADIGEDRNAIMADFGYDLKDIDGDGKKTLSFAYFGLNDTATSSRFQTEVVAGDHHIYIVNDDYYEKLVGNGVLAGLDSVLGYMPEGAMEDGYGIRLKYLHIGETDGFDLIERNSILCLRTNSQLGADYKNGSALYKNNVDLFRRLLTYERDEEHKTAEIVHIGKQTLFQSTVNAMEYSLYHIGRERSEKVVPLLEYEEHKLKIGDYEQVLFGDEDKAAAEALAEGGKIMILHEEVYKYLRDKGLLAKLSSLGVATGDEREEYGVRLSDTRLVPDKDENKKETHAGAPGFASLFDDLYLCAGADAEGYNAEMFKYLREWTEE